MRYCSIWMFLFLFCTAPVLCLEREQSVLVPDYGKFQFAGNIGFFSLGAGYEFLQRTVQADFMYGFVPKSEGGKEIHSITLKMTIAPGRIYLGKGYEWVPVQFGGFANFAIGDNYKLIWPGYYPRNYYHSTSFNSGEFIGMRIGKKLSENSVIDKIDIYAEIGTLTIYIHDYINSDYIDFGDIFNLALGVTVYFK